MKMDDDGRRNRREVTVFDDIPDGVLDNIVSILDLDEAVRAGLVATRWRHCWKFVRKMRFNSAFYEKYIEGTNRRLDEFVNSIVREHIGPISNFEINGTIQGQPFDISEGLRILSEKSVEKLDIYGFGLPHYELPREMYNFSSLDFLNLQYCQLGDVLPGFNGFPNLEGIRLCDVTVPDNFFRSIVTQSPKLRQIDFEFHEDGNPVELYRADALSNLESIYYQCKAMSTRPLRMHTCLPSLECALLETQLELPGRPSGTSKLDYVSSLLPCVSDLTFNNVALISLAEDVIPTTLTSSFSELDALCLEIYVRSEKMLSLAFCIIRNAPFRRVLEFNVVYEENNVDVRPAMSVLDQQLTLPPLETVEQLCFQELTNNDLELEFIKTLIHLCPSLRSVYFKPYEGTTMEDENELHDILEAIPLPEGVSFKFDWVEMDTETETEEEEE